MATIGSHVQNLKLLNNINLQYASMNKHANAIATGQKINSAQDDASGFAIGTAMGVELGSLEQDISNVQNGASMLKVADGAVKNTLDILSTMKERALAAANSTMNPQDRARIQQEFNQYIDQINDNSLVTFNGMRLLDGSRATATGQANQAFTNTSLGENTVADTRLVDLTNRLGENLGIRAGDSINISYVKDGKNYSATYQAGDTTLGDIFKNANGAGGGKVFAEVFGTDEVIGQDGMGREIETADGKNGFTVRAEASGTRGAIAGFSISVTDSQGNGKNSINNALNAFTEKIIGTDATGDGALTLQTGTKSGESIKASLGRADAYALGLQGSDGRYLSVGTAEAASTAVSVLDNAINRLLEQSTNIGSLSSRLEYTQQNLTTQNENLTKAQSTLWDADLAKEITQYASSQILMQASQAMLAQSYKSSGWFLNLLG